MIKIEYTEKDDMFSDTASLESIGGQNAKEEDWQMIFERVKFTDDERAVIPCLLSKKNRNS